MLFFSQVFPIEDLFFLAQFFQLVFDIDLGFLAVFRVAVFVHEINHLGPLLHQQFFSVVNSRAYHLKLGEMTKSLPFRILSQNFRLVFAKPNCFLETDGCLRAHNLLLYIRMQLYNTLSRKIEEFVPLNPPRVGMYTCGPTVYDFQHIGNFRTMMLSDILYRTLKYNGFEAKSVRNITDIDDKIIKGAKEKNLSIGEYSKEYTRLFFEDTEKLNILPVDVTTYATEYVGKMVEYIKELIEKGYAYVEADRSVYFDISRFSDYGKLSRLDKRSIKSETRVLSDEYTKGNVQDFALWKSVKSDEREGYDSPWGRGRPGWHIECSVMGQDNLGDSFDIHVGGVDLIFPHHENEIAQSEAKTDKPFVKYWVHGEFLNVDGGKMSKSLGNFYTLRDMEKRGFDPLALRYFYLTAHYRTVLNFTWEALGGAQNALDKLRSKIKLLQRANQGVALIAAVGCAGYEGDFLEVINDDLNMPEALAVMWKLVDDASLPAGARLTSLLRMDKVLGLRLDDIQDSGFEIREVSGKVQKLIDEREKLREKKKFAESDQIREEIERLGYTIGDMPSGARLNKVNKNNKSNKLR